MLRVAEKDALVLGEAVRRLRAQLTSSAADTKRHLAGRKATQETLVRTLRAYKAVLEKVLTIGEGESRAGIAAGSLASFDRGERGGSSSTSTG
jgi:hypothetical protein